MNALLLFCEQADSAPLEWLAQIGPIFEDGGDRWIVSTDNGFIALSNYADFDNEFGEEDRRPVLDLIKFQKVWAIEWNNISLLSKLIEQIPLNVHMVIDNDCGLICDFAHVRGIPVDRWIRATELSKSNEVDSKN